MKSIVNCKRCKDRDVCTEPCPALDAQLKRDFPLNINVDASPGFLIPPGKFMSELDIWKVIEELCLEDPKINLTKREKAMLTLHLAGFSHKEIAKIFRVKSTSLPHMVYLAKKKLLQKWNKPSTP